MGETIGEGASAQITFDADAAGHGWYIDPTPLNNEDDYLPTSNPNVWQAKPDSDAAGKMDMLSVLLHEYGHALGIEHSSQPGDFMNATLQPGERRLPSPDEMALMAQLIANIKAGQSGGIEGGSPLQGGAGGSPDRQMPFSPLSALGLLPLGLVRRSYASNTTAAIQTDNLAAINPTLLNANFDYGLANWEALGNVRAVTGASGGATHAATLSESGSGIAGQSRLSQAFTLTPGYRFLGFTVSGLNLQNNGNTAQDAFEVAMIDANSGTSLLGGLGITHSDAALNFQLASSGGTVTLSERHASQVTSTTNPNGSRTYTIDLSAIAAGTAVNVSFDLIGFGTQPSQLGSTVTISNVHLSGAPEAVDDNITVAEDNTATINALANDLNAALPGYAPQIVAQAQHGQVSVNADGTFSYTPAANYFGADSFTYRLANTGSPASNVATVHITVTPVNDAPIARDVSLNSLEDQLVTGSFPGYGSDVDSASLSAAVVNAPAHGTLTVSADGSFSYMPDLNFNGVDSFTYKVSDGYLDSKIATVSLSIMAVNDAPVAQGATVTTAEDNTVSVNLTATDVDTPTSNLTFIRVSGPQHGTLSLNAQGQALYTPAQNYYGADSFTYKVNDGQLYSNVATVTLSVTPVNDAPVAANATVSTLEDTALNIELRIGASDIDSATLTPQIVSGPQHGSLIINVDGSYTYLPTLNYNGSDSFAYKVNDGQLDSNVATISINITPVNDAPVVTGTTVTTPEDTVVNIELRTFASDVDSATLTPQIVTGPQHGALTLNSNGTYGYRARPEWHLLKEIIHIKQLVTLHLIE